MVHAHGRTTHLFDFCLRQQAILFRLLSHAFLANENAEHKTYLLIHLFGATFTTYALLLGVERDAFVAYRK